MTSIQLLLLTMEVIEELKLLGEEKKQLLEMESKYQIHHNQSLL